MEVHQILIILQDHISPIIQIPYSVHQFQEATIIMQIRHTLIMKIVAVQHHMTKKTMMSISTNLNSILSLLKDSYVMMTQDPILRAPDADQILFKAMIRFLEM